MSEDFIAETLDGLRSLVTRNIKDGDFGEGLGWLGINLMVLQNVKITFKRLPVVIEELKQIKSECYYPGQPPIIQRLIDELSKRLDGPAPDPVDDQEESADECRTRIQKLFWAA
jgi:hypothetical protein